VISHQLQVERRTGKVRQSETHVRPLCHTTNAGSNVIKHNKHNVAHHFPTNFLIFFSLCNSWEKSGVTDTLATTLGILNFSQ